MDRDLGISETKLFREIMSVNKQGNLFEKQAINVPNAVSLSLASPAQSLIPLQATTRISSLHSPATLTF